MINSILLFTYYGSVGNLYYAISSAGIVEMKKLYSIAILASGVIGFSGQIANAQSVAPEDCTCVTAPLGSSTEALGNISLVNGQVMYSGVNGFEIATAGVQLVSGSQISVPAGAFANILVGQSCNMIIPAGSEASISQPESLGGDICVKVSEQTVVANTTPTPVTPAVSPLVPLAVIGGGAGLAIALGGGDNSASN